MNPLLVILDIDETLVYASDGKLERTADFKTTFYHVYSRPYLDEFISFISNHYQIAVWTSASAAYAEEVIPVVFPDPNILKFAWTANKCTSRYDPEFGDYYKIKNLRKVRKLGYSLGRTLVIDDTPQKHVRNYGNLIRVAPFYGAPDDELSMLVQYLQHIDGEANMRSIEKRGWRNIVETI
jgi:TFIIF-interacting CTD phosphatase-like protein